ncbi:hypothetical protein [Collinsella sp. Sow4_E3]|uniref:hypothetical protein n=1 Tax=Collinsella sp. Sow4_E3 TaxID=3438776 RepID=UPI003F93D1DC
MAVTLTLTIRSWRLHLDIGTQDEPEQQDGEPAPVGIDTPMVTYAEPKPQHVGFQQPMEAS